MDEQLQEHITNIENKLAEIGRQMAALEKERERVIYEEAEEYGHYVDQFLGFYPGETPLSIRQYYILSGELSEITEEIMAQPDDTFEKVWAKHNKRLQYLEKVLAA